MRQRFGPIRVLLNNAANDVRHRIEDTTPESWDAGIAVNLKHQFFAAQDVAADMQRLGSGSISFSRGRRQRDVHDAGFRGRWGYDG